MAAPPWSEALSAVSPVLYTLLGFSLLGTRDFFFFFFFTCLGEQREVTSKIVVNCFTLPPLKSSQYPGYFLSGNQSSYSV